MMSPDSLKYTLSYHIRFTFSSLDKERMPVFPVINMFLDALEDADSTMSVNLDLEIDCRRELVDMGQGYYVYAVYLHLGCPSQMLLGTWPESHTLQMWMGRVRTHLLDISSGQQESVDISKTVKIWDDWAKEAALTEGLTYLPFTANQLSLLIDNLKRALDTFGDEVSVSLEQS